MAASALFRLATRTRVFSVASRNLHRSSVLCMPAHDAEFEEAKKRLGTLTEDPGNDVKLQLYALFKQATVGTCNAPKPGMMDFVGKAKWEAWNKLGNMSQDEAQKAYIGVVDKLAKAAPAPSPAAASGSTGKFQEILVSTSNKLCTITLNRPTKKNALNLQMYQEIGQALKEAAADNAVTVVAITGAGDYYCSGNDLANFMNINPSEIQKMALDAREILLEFVGTFIDFPKPLLALVNGPVVGVAVTTLGLFDAVYATDRATFQTPFSALGQSPEGCSSYIFPKIMGAAKANELLLFNRKLTAQEAFERNLVSALIPDAQFAKEAPALAQKYALLPPKAMTTSKNLIREAERAKLHEVNRQECDLLVERWQSEECINAIMSFFQRKSAKL